ncbi:MAG TPA: antitoxin Xre/MbcA/ParS toxin-binding domain-containing protein [Gemmatimonadales bacterium]
MTVSPQRVARILGGERMLGRRVRTLADLRELVESGLPVESLALVVAHVTGSEGAATELKHRVVPKATLHRRRRRLSPEESERLERLARLAALAEEVWEDPTLASEFLTSPQPQLGGERPVDLSRSDLGARQVEQLLMKLAYALPV